MSKRRHSNSSPFAHFSVIAFLSTIIVFAMLSSLWPGSLYLKWVVASSITTLVFYVYDKSQSRRHGPRVPELVLHAMALMGGFLGGWLGMFFFRHKLRKPAFWAVLAGSTVLHAAISRLL